MSHVTRLAPALRFLLVGSLALGAALTGAWSRVEVTLDAATLNALLPSMAPSRVTVNLVQGRGVTLLLKDLKVTGFEPSEGESGGVIRTSLRLEVPELGLDVPVEPRLSLQVKDKNGTKDAFLRFDKVPLQLLATGAVVDVAPLLPVLPLLTDTTWSIQSSGGPVRVHTRLTDAALGAKNLRLGFELEAKPEGAK